MKKLGRIKIWFGVTLLLLVSVVFFVIALYSWCNAKAIGEAMGNLYGEAVGTAVGSVRGITRGIEEGAEAGAAEGLSANDTTVDVSKSVKAIGKLEVLAVGITIENDHQVGSAYEALYTSNAMAVFTVDLEQAKIEYIQEENLLDIKIPEPDFKSYVDLSSTERIAETNNVSFSVTAKDGFEAFINSTNQVDEATGQSVANYELLVNQAKESAIKKVSWLAATLCEGGQQVQVSISEEVKAK